MWWALAESFGSVNGVDVMPSAPIPAGLADVLAGLEDLDQLPAADHVERFGAVHNLLIAALSSIDEV